jgi:SAM-dependent methyltransferase
LNYGEEGGQILSEQGVSNKGPGAGLSGQDSAFQREAVRRHYETHPYPRYPLLASVRRADTYALNLDTLWGYANGCLLPLEYRRILVAGCGSFSPYPFAVANPESRITALDLARSSLRRARLHCLLHGYLNVTLQAGDLNDQAIAPSPFGLIDAYGVLHHLGDPLAGLKALTARLAPGGILRVMLYSHAARGGIEAARRALRRLGVRDVPGLKRLRDMLSPASRLGRRLREPGVDATFTAGLADAFLHPQVQTFTVRGLQGLLAESGLEILLAGHPGALLDPARELSRLAQAEADGELAHNFILYLVRKGQGACRLQSKALLRTNPCLARSLRLPVLPLRLHPRLGRPLPELGLAARMLLRRCLTPKPVTQLSPAERDVVEELREALLLVVLRD